jgi:fibronectin-binding autotransporter adhesin
MSLSGANTFSGPVSISGGAILSVFSDNNLGAPPGSATASSLVIADGSTLRATAGFALNSNRGIAVGLPSGGGAGTVQVVSDPLPAAGVAPTIQTLSYGGVIANNGAGASGLTKSGFGNLTLSGANTYTGPTTVRNGTLTLDFQQSGAPASNIVTSTSALTLGGGNSGLGNTSYSRLAVVGKDGLARSQSFASTLVDLGPAVVKAAAGSSPGTVDLYLGALSHNAGGVVNFILPSSGTGNIHTTNASGMIGAWATVGQERSQNNVVEGDDFAAVDASGNIVAYTAYQGYSAGTFLSSGTYNGKNVQKTAPTAQAMGVTNSLPGGITADVNTVSIKNTPASGNGDTIVIGASNVLRLGAEGGIFRQASSGSPLYIGGATNSGTQSNNGTNGSSSIGKLTAGGAANTPGTITFTINSNNETSAAAIVEAAIGDNGTGQAKVVKAGSGLMKLDGHNTYTGGTYILQGQVRLAGSEITLGPTSAANPDGFGTGPVYILPGGQAYIFGLSTGQTVANAFYLAGAGTNQESFGALRLPTNAVTFSGVIHLIGDAAISGSTNGATLGQITDDGGGFSLTIGSTLPTGVANANTTVTLASASDNWHGNTYLVGFNGSTSTTVHLGADQVIPDGAGFGSLIMGNSDQSASAIITLDLNGHNETINGLTSAGTQPGNLFVEDQGAAASTITIGNNNQSATFAGTIRDNGGILALQKIGSGTQILSGTNSYSGGTTVAGGVLQMNGVSALGATTATLTVSSGTVDMNGNNLDVGALAGSGGKITSTAPGALSLTVGNGNGGGSYAGTIQDGAATISLVKVGSGTQTLAGNNTYSGGATVNGTGTLFVAHVHALGTAGLTINDTATTKLQAGLTAPVQLTSLTIAGGASPTATLDMTDNNMVVHNGNIAATVAQLETGLNAAGTLWTGQGITSSTAVADAAAHANATVFAVGAIRNIDKNNNLIYSTWPASPSPDTGASGLATTDVLIKYTYFGDADLNGVVDNTSDYDLWSNGFTDAGLAATNGWLYGDFDYSGTVDNTTDYDLWSTGFVHEAGPLTGNSISAIPTTSVQAVPEPTSALLGAVGLVGLAIMQMRRSVTRRMSRHSRHKRLV